MRMKMTIWRVENEVCVKETDQGGADEMRREVDSKYTRK